MILFNIFIQVAFSLHILRSLSHLLCLLAALFFIFSFSHRIFHRRESSRSLEIANAMKKQKKAYIYSTNCLLLQVTRNPVSGTKIAFAGFFLYIGTKKKFLVFFFSFMHVYRKHIYNGTIFMFWLAGLSR